MKSFAVWINFASRAGIRDIVEGGVSGAVAALLALQLDVASPKGIIPAAAAGFIAAAIAVTRRKLVPSLRPRPHHPRDKSPVLSGERSHRPSVRSVGR